jgi:hypothetical protein
MGALHTAVGTFNDGTDPNTAVVKAARAHDFNAEQTTRLVETFNTARTIYHYKSATDRTAEFDLADPALVIPELFKPVEQAKQAAVNHDYSSYDMPEAHYEDGLEIKDAGVRDVDLGGVTEHMDTNLDTQGARAMRTLHVQRDLAKTARDESRIAGTKAAQIFNKVAAEISRGYSEECQDQYNRLMSGYCTEASDGMKDRWGPVMSKLSEFVPDWMSDAQQGIKLGSVIDDRDLGPYTDQLKEAKSWMEAEAEMLAVAGQLDKEADEFEREWMEAVAPILPRQQESTIADFLNPSLRKAAQAGPTSGTQPVNVNITQRMPQMHQPSPSRPAPAKGGGGNDFMGKIVQDAVSEGLKRPLAGAVESGIEGMLASPTESENVALSDRLKNVQRQIMLEDLMTNDPVLSDESPDTVAQAYQTILGIAPELASNKEVVRAILRQAVHSVAISPYEAQVWTDLEKNIRNLAGKADTRGRPVER